MDALLAQEGIEGFAAAVVGCAWLSGGGTRMSKRADRRTDDGHDGLEDAGCLPGADGAAGGVLLPQFLFALFGMRPISCSGRWCSWLVYGAGDRWAVGGAVGAVYGPAAAGAVGLAGAVRGRTVSDGLLLVWLLGLSGVCGVRLSHERAGMASTAARKPCRTGQCVADERSAEMSTP